MGTSGKREHIDSHYLWFWMPRHISIYLLINCSSNFLRKSRTEFQLSSILQYSRLLICLNIDYSWYMCCWNPKLVFRTKIPCSACNTTASLRFYAPILLTAVTLSRISHITCFYNMYRFLFRLLSAVKHWCALTLPYKVHEPEPKKRVFGSGRWTKHNIDFW